MYFLIMNDSQDKNTYTFIKDTRKRDNHIIPECYIDTTLMEILIPPEKQYNHTKGVPAVVKKMMEELIDNFAIAVLDKDPDKKQKEIKYFNEFELLIEINNIRLHRHKNKSRHHYLIFHPPFEDWIISEAKETKLSLESYNLPSQRNELIKITKPPTPNDIPKFKKLFKALKQNNAKGITLLLQWTDYLISNPYNADITKLKNIGNTP
jgi:hypothetical protein